MMRLNLWLTLTDGACRQAGELAFSAPDGQGRYRGAFRYLPEWLAHRDAFPLDPANLPLAPREFEAPQLGAPLMVLEDALPDAWGRRLLVLRHGLPRHQQTEPHLLRALAGRGLGAMSFHAPGAPPARVQDDADLLTLAQLAAAAARLEAGQPIDDQCRLLLAAGSSPGGARPKALVRDAVGHWIAKFGSLRDQFDEVGLEATGLALARRAGLSTPDFRLALLAGGRRGLLVRRFDLTEGGGRRHMISFRSLLAASGWYVQRYADLIGVLRKYSRQPERDVPALFRHMVFNALFGNTDDHLKNFWMFHDDAGFRLTPAFDLLPDTGARREHVLLFDLSPFPPGPAALEALGRRWGIAGSARLVGEVAEAVTQFAEVARSHAVPATEIQHFAQDIQRRLLA